MKQTVQLSRIQEKMKPGIITRDGFLGTDRRNLIDMLVEDDETVKRMDLTHATVAQRMIDPVSYTHLTLPTTPYV